MWLKVWKSFNGGRHDGFTYCENHTEQENVARNWAFNTPGGHNYGWVVYWEPVEKPTPEWLDKEMEHTTRQISRYGEHLEFLKQWK